MNKELAKYLKEGGTLGSLAKRPKKRAATASFPCDPAEVYETQVAALAKRLKRIGVKDVVIGISGGLDSALCLLVTAGAYADLGLDFKAICSVMTDSAGRFRLVQPKDCQFFKLKLTVEEVVE